MAFPSHENKLNTMRLMMKRQRILDLNKFPQVPSYDKEDKSIGSDIFGKSTNFSGVLQTGLNMVQEAVATIPLSFTRQEKVKSTLVVDKGILTLVQHPTLDIEEEEEEEPMPMHKRGLRTSWTVQFVDGNFELPPECVNYILLRDKYCQRLSRIKKIDCHLSVYRRLEGWRVETRKRPDKTHDKFYHHRLSRKMFRSLVEVEKFIKYEIYPPKPQRRKIK